MSDLSKIYSKLSSNPLAKRLLSGGLWVLSGNIGSKLLYLLTTIITAHILGKNLYGEYSIIRSTILLFVTFASMGVGMTSTKYIAQFRKNDITRAYKVYLATSLFSVGFGLAITIIVIALSGYISAKQLDAPYLSDSLKWGAVLLFFCTINGAQAGALSGFESFKEIARNTCISSFCELIAVIMLAKFFGVTGAIIGSGIGYIVLTCLNNSSIRSNFTTCTKYKISNLSPKDFRVIWDFGFPSALSGLIILLVLWLLRTYLVRMAGFGEIAVYNASEQINALVLFIPASLSQLILPILTDTKSNDSSSSYNKILNYNIVINITITSVLAIFVSLFSSVILHLWGKDFDDNQVLVLLAISSIFASFANVVGLAIASQGKMWIGFAFNVVWAVIITGFGYYFIYNGNGAVGLAYAYIIAYACHGIFQFIYLRYLNSHEENNAGLRDSSGGN